MAIRNCADIGENLQRIVKRLLANDDLVKLLYYTDKDPLNNPSLTETQLREEVLNELIKVVPRVGPREDSRSVLTLRVVSGLRNDNSEFKNVLISVEVFVPLTQWFIKDENLRPFKIMGEIQRSLDNKTINGLGKMIGGDFTLNFLTEEFSSYEMEFWITSYE